MTEEIAEVNLNTNIVGKDAHADKYDYMTLSALAKALNQMGIRFRQSTELRDDGQLYVTTSIKENDEEWTPFFAGVPVKEYHLISKAGNSVLTPPQEQGVGITYARRYSLQMAAGIVAEDDNDAQLGKGNKVSYPASEKQISYAVSLAKQHGIAHNFPEWKAYWEQLGKDPMHLDKSDVSNFIEQYAQKAN